jgi:hypothetical protein
MKLKYVKPVLLCIIALTTLGSLVTSHINPTVNAQYLTYSPVKGKDGTNGTNVTGAPTSRTVSLATAYQASTTTKPAVVTVNLTSSAGISLSGGTTNTAAVMIGATNGVAGGTGTTICNYSNSNTGTLTIGLNLNTIYGGTCSFILPTGWYFAVRQTAGTVTITSVFDQVMG